MALGQLLLPTIIIDWGDVSLGRLFYGLNMSFRAENEGHDLSFSFEPSSRGYELYRRCVTKSNRPKPIFVTVGYPGGKSITGEFLYAGATMGSGTQPEITVNAMSGSIARLNRYRLNKTFGDGTSELNLSELMRLESAYRNVTLDTSSIGKVGVTHTPIVGETTAEFIQREVGTRGFHLTLPLAPSISHADMTIKAPYTAESSLEDKEVKEATQTPDNVSEGQSDRYAYFISLTAIQDFTRTIRYTPSTKSSDTTSGAGSAISTTALPDEEDEETVTESAPSLESQEEEAPPEEEKVTGSESSDAKSEESSLDTPSTTSDIDIEEAQTESFKELVRECGGTVFMSPRLTGLKPEDFILLPSIKGDYAEDWLVTSVSYAMETGGITMSFTGKRWQKDEPMVENYDELISKLTSRKTVQNWNDYYWVK